MTPLGQECRPLTPQFGDCAASKSKPTPLRSSPDPEELRVGISLCASPLGAHLHKEAQYPPQGRQAGPPAAQCRHTVGLHRGTAGDGAALRSRRPESGSLLGARSQDSPQELLFPENTVFPEASPALSPESRPPPPHPHTVTHYCSVSLCFQIRVVSPATAALLRTRPTFPLASWNSALALTSSPQRRKV